MICYTALALQMRCRIVNNCTDRAESQVMINDTIERVKFLIDGARLMTAQDIKLVVLPEYFLTGFPLGVKPADWAKLAAVELDGPEHQRLAQIAKDTGVYLCANAYELDENFPGIFFQSNVIFDPDGKRILRYRRLTSMYSPTPHDFLDKYLELYGWEGVFPVARTPIGNLAAISSEEMQYPELVRSFALRGAEVLCHPCSEPTSNELTPKELMKRARALENMAYVVSANSAGIEGTPTGDGSCDGHSKIIDFKGRVMVEAAGGESTFAHADLNISQLRRYRQTPHINNFFTRQRMELYRQTYNSDDFYPANSCLDAEPTQDHFRSVQAEVMKRLVAKGVITPEES